jgi:hypothetical protein
MASEARSWADQWGAGGIGARDYEEIDTRSQKDTTTNKKNTSAKAGFTKAKAIATIGLEKIKSGASICVKWITNHFKKKRTSI